MINAIYNKNVINIFIYIKIITNLLMSFVLFFISDIICKSI